MSDLNTAEQAEVTTAKQTAEEIAAAKSALKSSIVAKFNNLVDVKEMKFNFKSDKETGFKRPTVELHLPVPSVEGIVYILENADTRPKELELLLESLADVVNGQLSFEVRECPGLQNMLPDLLTMRILIQCPHKANSLCSLAGISICKMLERLGLCTVVLVEHSAKRRRILRV